MIGEKQQFIPAVIHKEKEMRPITDYTHAFSPGAHLIACGKDAVMTGDPFLLVDIHRNAGLGNRIPKGREFLVYIRDLPLRSLGKEALVLAFIIKHVAIKTVQNIG